MSYTNLKRFINKAQERAFNDALMRLLIVEIELKSGEINENILLPRYYNIGTWYGEYYPQSAVIKDLLPKKALLELKALCVEGSKQDLNGKEEIRNWINRESGISISSLSGIFE